MFIAFIERVGEKRFNVRLAALYFFCNEFHKFNKTGAQMLDSIYHITLIYLNLYTLGDDTSIRYFMQTFVTCMLFICLIFFY